MHRFANPCFRVICQPLVQTPTLLGNTFGYDAYDYGYVWVGRAA